MKAAATGGVILAACALLAANSRGFLAYVLSQPGAFGPWTWAVLGNHALDLLVVAAAAAGAAALGRRALCSAGLLCDEPGWMQWLCGLVTGEAVLALLIWVLVALGACTPGPAAVLWLGLAAAAARDRRALRELLPRAPSGFWARAACVVISAALLRGAATAGAPLTNWDALTNHFAVPKIYLIDGAFHRLPWSLGAHYPLNAEMLYAWLFVLRGEQAALWLGWLHGAIFVAACGAWASALAGLEAAWLSAALLAAAPPFARVLATGKNDLLAALAMFAALLAAVGARRDGRWLLTGLLAGAGASLKLNGLWAVAALGLLSLAAAVRARRAGPAAAFALGALVLGAPWYVRDWVWTGNPFWPMLGSWLGDAQGAEAFARLQASVGVGLTPTAGDALKLPYLLWTQPDLFLDPPRELIAASLLAAAACGAAGRRLLPREAIVFALLYGTLWFLVCQEGRLLLPLTPVLAVFAAAAWTHAAGSRGRRVVCGAALALAAAPVLRLTPNNELFGFFQVSEPDAAAARRRYLLRSIGAPYALSEAANALPPGSRVLLYREMRGYYIDHVWASAEPITDGLGLYRDLVDAEDLRRRIKDKGFTHVFYNLTLGPISGDRARYERIDRLYEEMIARRGRRVASAGPLALFALD